jgi:hypothetical protein
MNVQEMAVMEGVSESFWKGVGELEDTAMS